MAGNLYIPVGIPGSGKSTWCTKMLPDTVLVSSDIIREELFGSLRAAHDVDALQKRINNDRVWAEYYDRIERNLPDDNVIADATHLRDFARARLRDIAERCGAATHIILFDNARQAFKRNMARPEDEIVPEDVMKAFESQLEDAILDVEGHGEDYNTITRIQCVN